MDLSIYCIIMMTTLGCANPRDSYYWVSMYFPILSTFSSPETLSVMSFTVKRWTLRKCLQNVKGRHRRRKEVTDGSGKNCLTSLSPVAPFFPFSLQRPSCFRTRFLLTNTQQEAKMLRCRVCSTRGFIHKAVKWGDSSMHQRLGVFVRWRLKKQGVWDVASMGKGDQKRCSLGSTQAYLGTGPCTFKRLLCTHRCPVEGSVVPSSINQLSSNKIQLTNSKFPGKQLRQASCLGCVLLEGHTCLSQQQLKPPWLVKAG